MTRAGLRAQGAAGIAGMVTVVVGLVLPGAPPKTSDAVADVTHTLLDKRSEFLVSTYLVGIGCLFLLLFLGGLRAHLGREDSFAGSAFGAGVVAVALVMTGSATFDGLAFSAAGMHDPALVRGLVDAGNAQFAMAGLAWAALLVASSAAAGRTAALPRALRVLGHAAAALLVVTGLALAVDHGPLESGGALNLLGTLPLIVWVVGTGVTMVRLRPAPGPGAEPTP
jgi:hypothetical protein